MNAPEGLRVRFFLLVFPTSWGWLVESAFALQQHPDEHRPERPILLAVDQELGERACYRRGFSRRPDLRSVRHIREAVEVQVRTPLIFPDHREALAEFIRGLGYEPSTESPIGEPSFVDLVGASKPRLTLREEEILRLMAKGHTYREITETLRMGSRTVGTQVQNIIHKLRLRQRLEQASWYNPEPGRAFVLWLAGNVGAAAAEELAQAVAGWIREHLARIRRGGTVRVIYGPDDKPLAEVPIEEDDANECPD